MACAVGTRGTGRTRIGRSECSQVNRRAYWPIGTSARGGVICLPATRYPDETISPRHEIGLKRISAQSEGTKQTGATMLTFILNSMYREFLRNSLSGMRKHHFPR
jgi:hypothetical protein